MWYRIRCQPCADDDAPAVRLEAALQPNCTIVRHGAASATLEPSTLEFRSVVVVPRGTLDVGAVGPRHVLRAQLVAAGVHRAFELERLTLGERSEALGIESTQSYTDKDDSVRPMIGVIVDTAKNIAW